MFNSNHGSISLNFSWYWRLKFFSLNDVLATSGGRTVVRPRWLAISTSSVGFSIDTYRFDLKARQTDGLTDRSTAALLNAPTLVTGHIIVIIRIHECEFTWFVWWMQCQRQDCWPPTLMPSQSAWAESAYGSCHPHPPSSLIIITPPESWYSFTAPIHRGWKAESIYR